MRIISNYPVAWGKLCFWTGATHWRSFLHSDSAEFLNVGSCVPIVKMTKILLACTTRICGSCIREDLNSTKKMLLWNGRTCVVVAL